jgi:hypothetical protein
MAPPTHDRGVSDLSPAGTELRLGPVPCCRYERRRRRAVAAAGEQGICQRLSTPTNPAARHPAGGAHDRRGAAGL